MSALFATSLGRTEVFGVKPVPVPAHDPGDLGLIEPDRLEPGLDGVEIPMDFDPDEAEEIADEIKAAAARAKAMAIKRPKSKG